MIGWVATARSCSTSQAWFRSKLDEGRRVAYPELAGAMSADTIQLAANKPSGSITLSDLSGTTANARHRDLVAAILDDFARLAKDS